MSAVARKQSGRVISPCLQWQPVLERKLDEQFETVLLFSKSDTAYFTLNGKPFLLCHKLYHPNTNYYPKNWPTAVEVTLLDESNSHAYPPLPRNKYHVRILKAHSTDMSEYVSTDENTNMYRYDGAELYR